MAEVQDGAPRLIAVRILQAVLVQGAKANAALDARAGGLGARDRAWVHELVYATLRHFHALEVDVSRFLKQKPDDAVRAILLLGACQLRYMRTPSHAAVSAMVDVCRRLRPAAAGMVNAVLRRVADAVPPARLKPYQRAGLPQWMYAGWRDAFGADVVQRFCREASCKPKLTVAVFEDREAWMRAVAAQGIACEAGMLSPHAVLLPAGTPVKQLPGYADGVFQVMDQAAQVAALALPVGVGEQVLDVCAAPGGKTALLARCHVGAHIMAVEQQGARIGRLRENLGRLLAGYVMIIQGDARQLPVPDASMDAVLLDAPCTASGLLRRHPDVKFLHGPDEVSRHAALQRRMLQEAWRVLSPGGHLLYAVCSIHPAENEAVLEGMPGVQWQRRLFPSSDHDGFFFALLQKPVVAASISAHA